MNEQLRKQYGTTISSTDMDAVIRQYTEGPASAPVTGLSLVVNK
jgi:hypothetical protein